MTTHQTHTLTDDEQHLFEKYIAIRNTGIEFSEILVKAMSPHTLAYARDLGMAKAKSRKIILNDKSETEFLMDYGIFHPIDGYRNIPDLILARNLAPNPSPHLLAYLTANAESQYSIHRILFIRKGLGLLLQDLLTNTQTFLFERHGSIHYQPNMLLGLRFRSIQGIPHTTGSGIITTPQVLDDFKQTLPPNHRTQCGSLGFHLTPHQQSALHKSVFRTARESGTLSKHRSASI
jgi:hypothetical protein